MYVIKEMRLNRFERRPIVSNRQLFVAKGDCSATVTSKNTSDCYDDPSMIGATKTKALGLGSEMARSAWEKSISDGKSPDMPGLSAKNL